MASLPDPPQRIQNLVVNIPPGTSKSRITSVYFPAWVWLWWPSFRWNFVSANPRVSLRDAVYCRDLLRSEWYQRTFRPTWGFAKDQDAKTTFKNTEGGFRQAFGAGSKITGDRGDALVLDDPNDIADITSEAERLGVNEWWDSAAANRINDLHTSLRIGIQQRVHEEDWSGHVLPTGEWHHLIIQQEYEEDTGCKCRSCIQKAKPLGVMTPTDPRSKPGELLDARRASRRILRAERDRLGEVMYAAQHQQRPSPQGGAIFKEWWWRYWTPSPEKMMGVYSLVEDGALLPKDQLPLTLTSAEPAPEPIQVTHPLDSPPEKDGTQVPEISGAEGTSFPGESPEDEDSTSSFTQHTSTFTGKGDISLLEGGTGLYASRTNPLTHDRLQTSRLVPSPFPQIISKRVGEVKELQDAQVENVVVELPCHFDEINQSWDISLRDLRQSDFIAGHVYGRRGADIFLLDMWHGRGDIIKAINAVREVTERWPQSSAKLIESKANGPAVIDMLRSEIPGLIPINPEGDKLGRARAVTPIVEAGNVYLPHPSMPGYRWVKKFRGELEGYPNLKHDDNVDSFTQQLKRWFDKTRIRIVSGGATVSSLPENVRPLTNTMNYGGSGRNAIGLPNALVAPAGQGFDKKGLFIPPKPGNRVGGGRLW